MRFITRYFVFSSEYVAIEFSFGFTYPLISDVPSSIHINFPNNPTATHSFRLSLAIYG